MILPVGHSTEYLNNYKDGLIPMGKGLGCELDNHLVWKDSQLNIILGHDNVGKSYFILWYYLCLALKHELTFTLFMDENYHGKVFRDLIQMYNGKALKDQEYKEIRSAETVIEHYFKLVDNTRRYTPNQLMDIFVKSDTSTYLIDPFNALKSSMSYAENYEVLNDFKLFTKTEKKTIYINAHPATASGRRMSMYPEKHDWKGHIMPPLKGDIEGGKPFGNKADDFIVIHRLIKHPSMWNQTMVEVDKVKDTDTGGKPTIQSEPLLFDYNFGKGFKIAGVDPLRANVIHKPAKIHNGFNFDNKEF